MNKLSSPIKLIRDSFEIFFTRKNLVYFLTVYLVLVPFHIFSYYQSYFIDPNGNARYSWSMWVVLTVNLIFFILYFLTLIISIKGMKGAVNGNLPTIKDAFNFARKNLWQFFLVVFWVFLATVGGTILLIVPGIIFGIWLSQSSYVFVDKGLGVKESLRKSKELVKGRFWAVLGRAIVFGLFTLVCEIILNFLPYGFGGILTTLLGGLFMLPSFLLYRELSMSNG